MPGLLLWKDNQYLYKTENSLKEQKLGTIELKYNKKLSTATHTLELAETEQAKEKSEKESCQNKILDLEHTQAQLIEKIEKQEVELNDLKFKVSELEKSREDDLRSYQRMVEGFLKAFKSETRRILVFVSGLFWRFCERARCMRYTNQTGTFEYYGRLYAIKGPILLDS